ncbi:ATP-dependent zinc metalloprotease FtsH [Pseudohongiella spirulinae]|uniref:ATP-dependent zinc metalloprotease FtsH n=1 Tax=Pseudohongiella spirulinae TaxID=1249552 RepID=A0A0S2KGC5_9GAMM|nr:ATP-dependent zinc metalloprotease FtsH [Pseudohongiella spirulinae]ALO47371.1 ATP-dependent zinc metalloprotease FtsH [Pseudohongiella spirulinae]
MEQDSEKNQQHSPKQPAGQPGPFDSQTWFWMMLVFIVYYLFFAVSQPARESLSYSDFKQAVRQGEVSEVTFRGDQLLGTYRGSDGSQTRFISVQPASGDEQLLPLLEQQNVLISAESAEQPLWLQLLLGFLPWLLMIAFFIYLSRMMQRRMGGSGRDGLFGFSRSGARLFEVTENSVGYDEVAGADSAKQDLQEIIDFLKQPEKFRKIGAHMPRGILLMGPPGTGKTLLAKATAHEAGVPFFSISGSEFIEMFVGVGASRVRDMFKEARKRAPALIFIDEIDSVGRMRGTGLGGGNDEREQTLNQVLAEMDGFSAHEAVVVLAATNRPDVLDPALLRPGRFDRKVTLELPQQAARLAILKVHTRKLPLADDVNLEEMARMTAGFSGADLANLANEAALLAARRDADEITAEDMGKAHDRVVMGSERLDMLNPSERHRTAVHESGHALVAMMLPDTDPVHKMSIIPRGRALGVTEQLPDEDRHNFTEPYVLSRLSVLLAGRGAERLMLGNISSGAANDLEQATRLARMMVAQWGMSDKLGPVHFHLGTEHPFLGYEMTQERDYSEFTARRIDEEVRRIITEAERRTDELLTANKEALQRLIDGLLANETLEREEISRLLKATG